MNIENDVKLDFKDVLIRPRPSQYSSRKDVEVTRSFQFKHSTKVWYGVPIIAANMSTTGTLPMHDELAKHQMLTALHKHHTVDELISHWTDNKDYHDQPYDECRHGAFTKSESAAGQLSFYSLGIGSNDLKKFDEVYRSVYNHFNGMGDDDWGPKTVNGMHPIQMVCIDVANGYMEALVDFVKSFRTKYPHITIMAGNVVTGEMTETLIRAGVDIVKVGIGSSGVCTTRKMTGVGYPQLSAIDECAAVAHQLGAHICSDGGCTVPGDLAKAFGAGADFVMLGGMLAGHTESGGELISEWHQTTKVIMDDGKWLGKLDVEHKYKEFYGMSSAQAMNQFNGGVASYRAPEGKSVKIPYRGNVLNTIQDILGGIRSAMTYVGAGKLEELPRKTTFIRVNQQLNEVFGKS